MASAVSWFFRQATGHAQFSTRRSRITCLSRGIRARETAPFGSTSRSQFQLSSEAFDSRENAGKAPENRQMPENVKAIMDHYENRTLIEQGDGMKGHVIRHAGFLGLACTMTILYLMSAFDDVTSEVHNLSAAILRWLGPEKAKKVFLDLAARGRIPKDYCKDDPYMVIEPQDGLKFFTPVGLSAGFDTQGVAANSFFGLGFGFIELGPVAASDSKSIMFMKQQLSSRNAGHFGNQIAHLGVVGVCLQGQSSAEISSALRVFGTEVKFATIDLSSLPEKHRSGDALRELVLDCVETSNSVPGGGPAIFLHVSHCPASIASVSERIQTAAAAAAAAVSAGASGMVLEFIDSEAEDGSALSVVSEVYKRTGGRLVLVASGGIRSGCDALEFIEAGTTVVQISDIMLEQGPQACRKLKDEMAQEVMTCGYVQLQDAVGAAHRKKKTSRKNIWKSKV